MSHPTPTAARNPLARHPRALTREVFVVSSRRCGDTTPPRSSREGCTLTVKKVSVRLFGGLLDPMFDEFIEGLGCKSKRNL